MKKQLKIFFITLFCIILCATTSVSAASLNIHTISTNAILGVNTFRMNLPENISYVRWLPEKSYNVTLVNDDFHGAASTPYHNFQFNSADSYVTAIYQNVGWYNDGNGERSVNALFTLSSYKKGSGAATGGGFQIGFNQQGLTWILLNNGGGDGLSSDVQIVFYYSDDPTMQPINMGQAFVGVGGQNSEKRVWNHGVVSDADIDSLVSVLEVTGDKRPGIQGHQWEWVTYDTQVGGTLEAYKAQSCILSYVAAGATVRAYDQDTNGGPESSEDYGWGVSNPRKTFDVTMTNPTGYNVISNAGNRYDSWIDHHINSFVDSRKYANEYRDQKIYMVSMGTTNNNNGLKGNVARTDGQPFSVYKFKSGKDVGSVELGLLPISLATEVKKPGKTVDKTVVHEQEEFTYTITEQVGNMNDYSKRIDQRTRYTKFNVVDELPAETDYIEAYATNEAGNRLGTDKVTVSVSGKTVTFTFTNSFLNSMPLRGETYKFYIKVKATDIKSTDGTDYIASNKAKVILGTQGTPNYEMETEEVHTQVIYDILEKGDEHTIFNTKVSDIATPNNGIIPEIPGGRDNNTVDFEPQPGYYIDTVEWQTQSDRYAPTTEGLSNVTDIPSTGKVTIPEEKNGSESSYKFEETMDDSQGDTLNYDPFGKTTYTFNDVDNNHYVKITTKPMKMVINVKKVDAETGEETQGDASFENAQYTVYGDEALTEVVDVITLNEDGEGSSTELALDKGTTDAPYGEYWVKETVAPEGYNLDETVYNVKQTARDQKDAREKVSYHDIESPEYVKKGRISVVKSLNSNDTSENDPAAGCILYLTLESKGAPVYEATIDQYGTAVFEEIPYGTYTITESEDARAAGYKLIKPETGIYVQEQDQSIVRIFEEPPVEAYIQVTKKDAETGATIPVANTKYKIWSYKDNKYVELHSYPSGVISEFMTDASGMFTTPEPLKIGRYRLDELTPPTGYHNEDMDFVIEDGVYNWDDEELIIPITQSDIAQKARIQITKKAEVLVGAKQETDPDTGLEVYVPQYETRGLAGVTYKITAKENITTADGTVRMPQGQSVYVTTGEDGVATSDYLYLGEYEVTEANAPDGYALNTKAETVVLDYRTNGTDNDGKLVVLDDYTVGLNFENERIPYELSFDKTFGETEYNNVTEETKNSVKFGLYAAEDIKIYNSQVAAISKDKLVEIIPVVNGKCTATADLPVGSYYIKELNLDIPFRVDPTEYPFEFKPDCNTEKVTINIPTINNDIDTGLMNFLKVSRKVYNKNKALIDEIIANNDLDAFNEFAQEYGLAGSKYQVFFKVNGEYTPLQVKNADGEYEDIFFVTGETGIDEAILPVGTYYVKELEAPVDHELDPNYHAIVVGSTETNLSIVEDPKIQGKVTVIHKDIETGEIIYDIEEYEDDIGEEYHTVDREQEINDRYTPDFKIYELVEEKIPENKDGEFKVEEQTVIYYYERLKGHLTVIKKDAETGDRLKGCKFTIKDLITGQTLVENAVTDENGEWSMEDVPYGRYVFTEVEAPEGYVLEEGSIGAVFDVKTEETVFEIVNTGDIQVIALAIVAIVLTFGIVYISKRKLAKNK